MSEPFVCSTCERSYKTERGLQNHICDPARSCSKCGRKYKGTHTCVVERLHRFEVKSRDVDKTCDACGDWHPVTKNINQFRSYHDARLYADCYNIPEIHRETSLGWAKLHAYLISNNMTHCGYCHRPCLSPERGSKLRRFELDHVVPHHKNSNVGQMILEGRHWTTIEAELKHCRLLCVRCHSIVTFIQRQCGLDSKIDIDLYRSLEPTLSQTVRQILSQS